jgi:hypothetical protein
MSVVAVAVVPLRVADAIRGAASGLGTVRFVSAALVPVVPNALISPAVNEFANDVLEEKFSVGKPSMPRKCVLAPTISGEVIL